MSLIFSENFSAYANGLAVDPNIPNWVWAPQQGVGLLPNSCTVQPLAVGKYAFLAAFPGDWATLTYNVVFAQPYREFKCRAGGSTGFFELWFTAQSATVFPAGYSIELDSSGNWAMGYDTGLSGFIAIASGSITPTNINDTRFKIIMVGSVASLFINGVQPVGATVDYAGIGNPYPTGRVALTILSNVGLFTDIKVYDSPAPSDSNYLSNLRRRRR